MLNKSKKIIVTTFVLIIALVSIAILALRDSVLKRGSRPQTIDSKKIPATANDSLNLEQKINLLKTGQMGNGSIQEFLKLISTSFVFIVQPSDDNKDKRTKFVFLEGGKRIRIMTIAREGDAREYIPVFSSQQKLFDFTNDKEAYLQLSGADFLELVKEFNFVLNPGSEPSVAIYSAEIENFLKARDNK